MCYCHYCFLFQTLQKEAPVRLHQLEFMIPEDSFKEQFQVAEQAIQSEQQQLDNRGNVQEILKQHKAVFEDSGLAPKCNKCLEQMKQVCLYHISFGYSFRIPL